MSRLIPPAELAERALEGAGSAGRMVVVEESSEAELRFANNTVTTNGLRRERTVTVIAFSPTAGGIGVGVASGSGSLELSALVEAAETEAKSSPPAEDAAELVAAEASTGFATDPETTSLSVLEPVLGELAGLFSRFEESGNVAAGFARHSVTTTYLASTTGLRERATVPSGRAELVGRSSDGSRSSWAGVGTDGFDDVDLDTMEQRVTRNLAYASRRIELPAGRYEALLPGEAVADLLLMLDNAASGRGAEEGRNVFAAPKGRTRIGERVSNLDFNIYSDPADSRFSVAPFLVTTASGEDVSVFDNGTALEKVSLLDGGVVSRLRYHRAGAARSAGAQFTPPVDNLVVEVPGAEKEIEEMVAGTERALLLTCCWYIRPVDPATLLLTGLTRDGVFLVEHGEITGAVNNFRFNESPLDMLSRATEAGRTKRALSREWGEWLSKSAMPPLRVEGFNMSSVSPAT